MMNEVRIPAVTIGWIRHRSCRSVGTSGPPRVPPRTTFVEFSTAATHSPCYRPIFEGLSNLRQCCEWLLITDGSSERARRGATPAHLANRYRGFIWRMGER